MKSAAVGFNYSNWLGNPALKVEERKNRKTIIIDFTVPRDTKIAEREIEKKENHQELGRETKVLPVVELKGCLEHIEFQT